MSRPISYSGGECCGGSTAPGEVSGVVLGYIDPIAPMPGSQTCDMTGVVVVGAACDDAICRECHRAEYTTPHSPNHGRGGHLVTVAVGSGSSSPLRSLDVELFRPCLCPSFVHRGCFRDSRKGLSILNTRRYFACPICDFVYKLERLVLEPSSLSAGGIDAAPASVPPMGSSSQGKDAAVYSPTQHYNGSDSVYDTATITSPSHPHTISHTDAQSAGIDTSLLGLRVRRVYLRALALLWAAVLGGFVLSCVVLSFVAYGADNSEKNIPIAMKLVTTGALLAMTTKRPANGTLVDLWRAEFKRADVPVWPYYMAFGIFLTCVAVIILTCVRCATRNDGSELTDCDFMPCGSCCCGSSSSGTKKNTRSLMSSDRHILRDAEQRAINSDAPLNGLPPAVREHVLERRRAQALRDEEQREQARNKKEGSDGQCDDCCNTGPLWYDPCPGCGYYELSCCCDSCCRDSNPSSMGGGGSSGSGCCCGCGSQDDNTVALSGTHFGRLPYAIEASDGQSCHCGDCKADCEGGGEAVLIIIVIVVVLVILCALAIVVLVLVRQTMLIMRRAALVAYHQALEEEQLVCALAIHETWRPASRV